jgi:glucose/arabinose dehydrogenase
MRSTLRSIENHSNDRAVIVWLRECHANTSRSGVAARATPQNFWLCYVVAMKRSIAVALLLLSFQLTIFAAPKLTPHHITLANGKSFDLNLPNGFEIAIAAQGLKRVRFMALSPDNRLFVTDMYNKTDNSRGVVYILDQFDPDTHQFKKITKYLSGLRNPNSIAFYTDRNSVEWFYLALTDRLVRYRYERGKESPSGEPQVLATFPDYGLGYKYGGWHLTRTVLIGGNGKLYISVGSSCNACEEKEEVRASILEMDPDGKNQRHFARGLRNAVGLRWVNNRLYATNMGSDHLGPNRPADTFYSMQPQANSTDGTSGNYGWPYCFQAGPKVYADPKFNPGGAKFDCAKVPHALVAFDAHSSPLGFDYFENSFLVALHGSTTKRLGRGYRVVRLSEARAGEWRTLITEDFITGFLASPTQINGRPCDVFNFERGFFLTDDYSGVVYYVFRRN